MNLKELYKGGCPKSPKNFNPNSSKLKRFNLNHLALRCEASLGICWAIKKTAIGLIIFYKGASFFQKGSCKHHPTCSEYALECFQKLKPLKAFWLTVKRIFSCHPFSQKPFYDPAPEA